jgi:hypothetical protein
MQYKYMYVIMQLPREQTISLPSNFNFKNVTVLPGIMPKIRYSIVY